MAIEDTISENLKKIQEWLNEQVWYLEAKGKWDSLEPDQRKFISWGSLVGCCFLFLYVGYSVLSSTYGVRSDVSDKTELLVLLENANQEVRNLTVPSSAEGSTDWKNYLRGLAPKASIDVAGVNISDEKSGNRGDSVDEALLSVEIGGIDIKQVVNFAYSLESGSKPVKLRELKIEKDGQNSGFLKAKFSVSALTVKESK